MELAFHNLKMTPTGKKFMAELNWLAKRDIHVGFKRGVGVYEDGTDVVDVAMYNEYGTSRIPSRPFMRQSFEQHKTEYILECERIYTKMIKGQKIQGDIKKFGYKVKDDIYREINLGAFVPNAPSTIHKKGFNKPLYETGLLGKSIVYETKKRK